MIEPITRWIDLRPEIEPESFGFERHGSRVWRTNTRVGSTPVTVELVPWGDDGAELILRPTRRPLFTWGRRRASRYFDLAHETANAVARELSQPAAKNAHLAPSFATKAA